LGVNQIEADKADKEEKRWEGLSTGEKVKDWGKRYQWSIVGGRSVDQFEVVQCGVAWRGAFR